jgi:para-nitrobenzyl esterase
MPMCFRTAGLALLAIIILGSSAGAVEMAGGTPEITLTNGHIRGMRNNHVLAFRGIPYAAPPVGENRWRSATDHPGWTGVLDTTQFGPQCRQPYRKGRKPQKQSEDCLTLNVWADENVTVKKPVMVWIHGGAYRYGSSSLPFYNGTGFAKSGVVLVSINYRLGRFGFFAHPAINGPDAGSDGVTNFALTDQLQALKWVQQNISKFGGDPDNVTLFGESAGALSVGYLIAEKKAQGLFHKAIMQSIGAYKISPYAWKNRGRRKAISRDAQAWASRYGLDGDAASAMALRSLTADQVLDIEGSMAKPSVVNAAIDGVSITHDLSANFAAGRQSGIPIMIGANSFEGSLMDLLRIKPKLMLLATWKHRKQARRVYQTKARKLSDQDYAYELFADGTFVAPARKLARDMTRQGQNAWVYTFDFRKSADPSVRGGASHGQEIPFVFDTLDAVPALFTGAASAQKIKALSNRIHARWVQFAKTGNPNASDRIDWPKFSSDTTEKNLVFDLSGERLESDFRADILDLHDTLFQGRLAKANK